MGVSEHGNLGFPLFGRVILDPATPDPAGMDFGGPRRFSQENTGPAVSADAAGFDQVVAVARADGDAARAFTVLEKSEHCLIIEFLKSQSQFDPTVEAFQEWEEYAEMNADRPGGSLRRAELALVQGDQELAKKLTATSASASVPMERSSVLNLRLWSSGFAAITP